MKNKYDATSQLVNLSNKVKADEYEDSQQSITPRLAPTPLTDAVTNIDVPARPTYEQLVELVPLLAKRPQEEVEQLVDIFEEYGYLWESDQKAFFNKHTGNGFYNYSLAKYGHKELTKKLKKIILAQVYTEIWHKGILKVASMVALWIMGGWILVDILTWLLVIGGLVLLLFMFHILMLNPPSWFPILRPWTKDGEHYFGYL